MKNRVFFRLSYGVLVSCLLFAFSAEAQIDPSSALLLRSSGADEQSSDFDSNRYTVRPGPRTVPKKPKLTEEDLPPGYVDLVKKTKPKAPVQKAKPPTKKAEPEISQAELRAISKKVAEYKKRLDPRDARHNILELTIAPTYIYNDSSSKYWYRNYSNHGAGLDVTSSIWFTPFVGARVRYLTTLGSDIKSEPGTSKRVEADHQWIDAGLIMRKYFGISRKSSYLSFGLDYREYQFLVPKNEANRVQLKSSGVRFSMESGVPKSSTYHWLLGVELVPRTGHVENKTALNLMSGSGVSSDLLGVWFGGKFQFDRGNKMFWKISHSVEKNLFKGTANTNDPVTGSAPEGVSVTNSFTLFQLGVTWGD